MLCCESSLLSPCCEPAKEFLKTFARPGREKGRARLISGLTRCKDLARAGLQRTPVLPPYRWHPNKFIDTCCNRFVCIYIATSSNICQVEGNQCGISCAVRGGCLHSAATVLWPSLARPGLHNLSRNQRLGGGPTPTRMVSVHFTSLGR